MRTVLPSRPPVRPTSPPPGRAPRTAIAGRLAQWARVQPDTSHSRRVALLKRVLPAIGVSLMLLVAVWPRLAPLLERMRFAFPAIDLREARELRMLNPRYLGSDRENRPFVVTAAVGQQVPDNNDLMSLEQPRADMKAHDGASVVVTAATGIYQSQGQILDLFGNVTLVHENGTKVTTDTARFNVADNSGQGDDPVEGHGPTGDLKAQEVRDRYFDLATQRYRAYPVVDAEGRLLGLLTRTDIQRYCEEDPARPLAAWFKDAVPAAVTPDETGQEAASRMALENLDRLPVVSDDGQGRLLGMLTRFDVVKALLAHYESDAVAERLLDLPLRGRRKTRR